MRNFQTCKLSGVHAQVVVAGTTAAHGFTVKNGTASVGTIALSTSTAGVQVSATLSSTAADLVIPASGTISTLSLTDETGTADFIFEYEVLPTAVKS